MKLSVCLLTEARSHKNLELLTIKMHMLFILLAVDEGERSDLASTNLPAL